LAGLAADRCLLLNFQANRAPKKAWRGRSNTSAAQTPRDDMYQLSLDIQLGRLEAEPLMAFGHWKGLVNLHPRMCGE
jgi:hypothetical protein